LPTLFIPWRRDINSDRFIGKLMFTRRDEIVAQIQLALGQISKLNDYYTDFERITYWQATPTQYEQNHLNFRDESEDYDLDNTKYHAKLPIIIEAIVMESQTDSAAELGTLALKDLMKAVGSCSGSLRAALFAFKRSHKYVETKGRTAVLVELEIEVLYRF
jgi:hypothetical protein